MRRRDTLLVRGIRWRLGGSLLTVLTATVAVAVAVLGPLYLHTAGDSVMRSTVAAASVQNRGITLLPRTSEPVSLARMTRAAQEVQTTVGARGRHGALITSAFAGASVTIPGNPPQSSMLLARSGICQDLRILAGRCRLGSGDAVVTESLAHLLHAKVGRAIDPSVAAGSLRLTVTGIAAPPAIDSAALWGDGASYFPVEAHLPASKRVDSILVAQSTVVHLPPAALATVTEQLPIRPHSVDLADTTAVQAQITRVTAALRGGNINLTTDLPAVIGVANRERHTMRTIIALAAIQLVLLAVWVLASVLIRSGDARRSEARVARLRGFTPASVLWVTAAEPALLCLTGAVLGVVIAFLAVLLARADLLVPGSAIVFDAPAILALALTLLAIVGALGAGTVRLLRSTEIAESATQTARGSSPVALAADIVLVVLALVALIALGTTGALAGHTDPVAAAAPGLIALGAAVLAVQIILILCRLGVRVTAGSGRIATFLALRQTARRPGVVRQARVLVIALGLACFATAAWSVARNNRVTIAGFQVGAHRVIEVSQVGASTLQHAVDVADPHGRWAMAAVEEGTASTTLLAVQADRLPVAAAWPRGITAAHVARVSRTLAPEAAPVIDLSGDTLEVSASTSGSTLRHLSEVDLDAWVFSASGGTAIIDLGHLSPGARTYRASLSGECPGGCRLTGLGVLPVVGATPTTGAARVQITSLRSGRSSGSLTAAGWRVSTSGVQLGGGTLSFTAPAGVIGGLGGASGTSSPPLVSVADRPASIPAVATAEIEQINSGANGPLLTEGLDGGTIGVHPEITATALPRIGGDALLVNLAFFARAQVNPTAPGATDEVWIGPHAPRDALTRLRGAGLHPTGAQSATTVFNALQRTAPALADDFLLIAAAAALLLAAASTLGALGATTRERATELTALQVAGVPRSRLARALTLETVILLITALAGVGAGVLAGVLAAPSLPELVAGTLAPLSYSLPVVPIVIVCATVLTAIALAAGSVTTTLLRRMSPTLLRTAPDDVSG